MHYSQFTLRARNYGSDAAGARVHSSAVELIYTSLALKCGVAAQEQEREKEDMGDRWTGNNVAVRNRRTESARSE
jgi:hypothetical protein